LKIHLPFSHNTVYRDRHLATAYRTIRTGSCAKNPKTKLRYATIVEFNVDSKARRLIKDEIAVTLRTNI